MDLSRKRDRDRLKPRREPYWQRLAEGQYLGFRSGPGTWVARYRGWDGKQQYHALGEGLDFDQAKELAEAWLERMTGAAVRVVKRATVRAALETYLADLRRQGRDGAADGAEWRFKKYVYEDPLASLEMDSATRDDFEEWRDRQRPGRANRTINRQVRAVKAALNLALDLGHVGNPAAWALKALADDVEDSGETAVFLDAAQRRALIDAADPYTAQFLRGLELTGARPHELAAAKVAHLHGESLRLAHRKGRPPKLRVRYVVLGSDGVEFFRYQARGKLPAAPLLTEDGETTWRTRVWARRIRAAISSHNERAKEDKALKPLPVLASAYSFRHARISELLQVYGIDPLTVAAQTGTSLAMIERAYLKFIPSAMREKLAAVK
jgi:integrase